MQAHNCIHLLVEAVPVAVAAELHVHVAFFIRTVHARAHIYLVSRLALLVPVQSVYLAYAPILPSIVVHESISRLERTE